MLIEEILNVHFVAKILKMEKWKGKEVLTQNEQQQNISYQNIYLRIQPNPIRHYF